MWPCSCLRPGSQAHWCPTQPHLAFPHLYSIICFRGLADYYIGLGLSSIGKEATCIAGDPSLIPGPGRSAGEGIGYPLQYSGLENSMDCIVHRVAKSWTWVNDFHFTSLYLTWTCESGNKMFHSSHLPPVCSLSSTHLYPLWDECAFSTFHTLPGSPPCKPFSDHCHTHPQLQWAATFNHMLAFLCEHLFFYFHLLVFIHLPRKLWAPRVMESWFCIPNT